MATFPGREPPNDDVIKSPLSSKARSLLRLCFGHPIYWVCQSVGWGGVLIIGAIGSFSDPSFTSSRNLHAALTLGILFVLSHFYWIYIQISNWRLLQWKCLLGRCIGAAFIIALIDSAFTGLIGHHLLSQPPMAAADHPELAASLSSTSYLILHLIMITIGNFLLMIAWSAAYFGYHLSIEYQKIQVNHLKLKMALRESEHRALVAQVNPHFLFNSLNTLRSLIEENPERARDAVTELAQVFRASLQTTRQDLITLREEIETVNAYISLEMARFEDRLDVRSEIPPETLEAKLPPFLLQTLIENAIRYGLGPRMKAHISYETNLGETGLFIRVTNPGRIDGKSDSTGIGLENSRLRLRLLFGANAFLHLTSQGDDTVVAEALIPQVRLTP